MPAPITRPRSPNLPQGARPEPHRLGPSTPRPRQGSTPLPARPSSAQDTALISALPPPGQAPLSDGDALEELREPAGGRRGAPPRALEPGNPRPLGPPILVGPPALFPAPWALLQAMTLTEAERRGAVCLIYLDPRAALPQAVGVRVGRALHVFGYEALKRWLRESSGYGQNTFKNPANGLWTPRSAIRRIVMPPADGGCRGPAGA